MGEVDDMVLPQAATPDRGEIVASEANEDLVVGLVGAVGTDLPWVERHIVGHLSELDFKVETLSLSELMAAAYQTHLPERSSVPYDDYVDNRMTAGNVLRSHWESPEALALLAIEEVRKRRDLLPEESTVPMAFVLRSLKRPEEIALLRTVYRGQFVLVGCHTPRDLRLNQLADQIAKSRGTSAVSSKRASAEQLTDRDEHELGSPELASETRGWLKRYGQSVEQAFPLADAYINLQNKDQAAEALSRFFDLLLGSPFVSPSRDEVAMFHAGAAAVRSSDMSRQVGAAIATDGGDIIAVGCNEVPRAGGGAYWEGDVDDARDHRLEVDANQDHRERAMHEVFKVLSARGLLTPKAVAEGETAFAEMLDDTRVDGLIEFTRSTHAEMAALLDAARRGVSVQGATLFTSTFPCHNCAKHIVTAGIRRVVFIEPYPKSLAEQLHGDAIAVDRARGDAVRFEHFAGVAPMNYFALFEATEQRKTKDGSPARFTAATRKPKLRGSFYATPLPHEEEAIRLLADLRQDKGVPSVTLLSKAPSAGLQQMRRAADELVAPSPEEISEAANIDDATTLEAD
jgi:deoxycytidylate deaminase